MVAQKFNLFVFEELHRDLQMVLFNLESALIYDDSNLLPGLLQMTGIAAEFPM